MTIDQAFLDVEKRFMSGQTDYVDGERRLWAAEVFARGKARCNTNVISDCAQGVPANPPMLKPTITITADKPRTMAIFDQIQLTNWPWTRAGASDLIDNWEKRSAVDLSDGLKILTNTDDGYIAIRPLTSIQLSIVWRVTPIYRFDMFDFPRLNRWGTTLDAIEVSYLEADYSIKSKCLMRFNF